MNVAIERLMLEAGYAAPEIATRAQKLSILLVQDCANWIRENYDHEVAESLAWYLEIHYGLHKDYV